MKHIRLDPEPRCQIYYNLIKRFGFERVLKHVNQIKTAIDNKTKAKGG